MAPTLQLLDRGHLFSGSKFIIHSWLAISVAIYPHPRDAPRGLRFSHEPELELKCGVNIVHNLNSVAGVEETAPQKDKRFKYTNVVEVCYARPHIDSPGVRCSPRQVMAGRWVKRVRPWPGKKLWKP